MSSFFATSAGKIVTRMRTKSSRKVLPARVEVFWSSIHEVAPFLVMPYADCARQFVMSAEEPIDTALYASHVRESR